MAFSYLPITIAFGVFITGGIALYDSQNPTTANREIALNEISETVVIPGWIEFVSEKSGFKTFFPSAPQYVEQILEDPESKENHHYEIFAAEQLNGTVYMVNLITYGLEYKAAKPQALFDEVIKNMQKNNDNKLTKSEETMLKGLPAKNFQLEQDKLTIIGTAFIDENKVYVISYIAKNGQANRQEFEQFLSSFDFTKK